MASYLLNIEEDHVRKGADAIGSAGDQLLTYDLSTHLRHLAEAIPGTSSAVTATTLGEYWKGEIRDWAKAAHQHKERTHAAADHMKEADLRSYGEAQHRRQGMQ